MRGEGNHKIPGSFAPENMEKTGAERVKYSLACQHEDAIPIKFVSYAQKCPTVLCTFAVALRKESVDRNSRGSGISYQYVVLQVTLKEKFIGTGSGNLTELEKVINEQAAKGYRLHTISTTSSGSKGIMGGDRIQATMVFEKLG